MRQANDLIDGGCALTIGPSHKWSVNDFQRARQTVGTLCTPPEFLTNLRLWSQDVIDEVSYEDHRYYVAA